MSTESISKSDRIIDFITEGIRKGDFLSGQPIPSISSTAREFGVARKTVVRAYEKLKKLGLIESRPKTGFFVINKRPSNNLKVLLLVHSFNAQWEILYNAFREKVQSYCDLEVYFHHYNINKLDMIVSRNVADYDLFLISSFDHPRIKSIIGRIPAYKVLIISRKDRLDESYNSIVQDFKQGTYNALNSAHVKICKYKKLVLSFPEKGWYSPTLKDGFMQFCRDNSIPSHTVNSLRETQIKEGEAYLVMDDQDIIQLIKICKAKGWEIGTDVGLISYHETPIKEVILNGISVISCNFAQMAKHMAAFIKKQKAVQEVIPIEFISRRSL